MLTDADGVVLQPAVGGPQLLAALDEVYLAPGFAYAERDVGTNGLGLALADRAPTLVRADQHYAQNLDTFTCAAVPVLDPAYRAVGRQRQPDDVVTVVERSASGAGAVGGQQHHRADVGAAHRPNAAPGAARPGVPRRGSATGTRLGNTAFAVGGVELRDGRGRACDVVGPHRVGRRGRWRRARHAARPGRPADVSARPHSVGGRAESRRCADLAGTVGPGTRQGPHRGHRARRRPAAGMGRRAAAGSGVAQRLGFCRSRRCPGAVRGDRRAVRRHPHGVGVAGRHRRRGGAPARASRRCAAARAHIARRRARARCAVQRGRVAGAVQLRLARKRRSAAPDGDRRGQSRRRHRRGQPPDRGVGGQHPSPVPYRGVRVRRDHPGARHRQRRRWPRLPVSSG